MEQFFIALTQIGIFFILILLGIVSVKAHILDEHSLEGVSNLVIKVSLPCYIFINACESATLETLAGCIVVIPLSVGIYICLILVCGLLGRVFRIAGDRGRIYRVSMTFGNIGFMGIPLVSVIYPEHAILYVSVFTIVDQLFFWTYGVRLTSPVSNGAGEGERFDPRNLISPPLVAIILAIAAIVAGVQVPGVAASALSAIGATSMPLALIYIGGILCMTDIRPVLRSMEIYAGVVVKMLLLPVVCFIVLKALGVAIDMAGTLSFMVALPGVEIVPMLAKSSGSDGDYAVSLVMMTTVASLVTLPLVSLALTVL